MAKDKQKEFKRAMEKGRPASCRAWPRATAAFGRAKGPLDLSLIRPHPTGLRYCMNGVSLTFKPA